MKTAAYLKAHPNILRIGSVVVFFIAWEYFGRDVNPLFLSYPSAIGRAFMGITETGVEFFTLSPKELSKPPYDLKDTNTLQAAPV